jgi:hypothetical protein
MTLSGLCYIASRTRNGLASLSEPTVTCFIRRPKSGELLRN